MAICKDFEKNMQVDKYVIHQCKSRGGKTIVCDEFVTFVKTHNIYLQEHSIDIMCTFVNKQLP